MLVLVNSHTYITLEGLIFYRYGTWGVCFIYSTWWAISGLVAAEKTYSNCLAIRKATEFLLNIQCDDGGWGESYLSCPNKVKLRRSVLTLFSFTQSVVLNMFVNFEILIATYE